MKKFNINLKKLTIIFAIVFGVSAIGFVVTAALTTGFQQGVHWNLGLREFEDGDSEHEFAEEYTNIDIRITSSNTVITPSSDGITRVSLQSGGNPVRLEAEVRNDTLYVRERWSRRLSIINLFSFSDRVWLIIEIPERHYENISFNVTSGRIETDGLELSCRVLDVGITSGNININLLPNIESYAVRVTSGNVILNGVSGSGEVRVTSGSITVRYSEWNDSLNARVTSGNLDFYLPEDSGLRVNSRVTSGRVNYSLDGESGRITRVDGARFGGDNIQDVELNVTSGIISFNN